MTKILSICNHKGGVGKTTTVLNIGAGLHKMKKKVLLIDMDPQANLSQAVGMENQEFNIYGALKGEYKLTPIPISNGLDIVPAVVELTDTDIELNALTGKEKLLRKCLSTLSTKYDFIIIDCPPSLGLLTINSLSSSDEVLIPLQVHYFAIHGLNKLLHTIAMVQEEFNNQLVMGGIILTQFNKRKILNRDIENAVKNKFKDKVFNTAIRDNVALAEAPGSKVDIFQYNKNCNGAKDYYSLSNELAKKYQNVS